MSILKELTEETTDRQDSKKLAHLKTYTFFVFYQTTQTFMPSTLHVFHHTTRKWGSNSRMTSSEGSPTAEAPNNNARFRCSSIIWRKKGKESEDCWI